MHSATKFERPGVHFSKYSGKENFNAYEYEDNAAEAGGFSGKTGAEALADGKAGHADAEGDDAYKQAAYKSGKRVVFGNCKAYAESVNAGGNTLKHQRGEGDGAAVRFRAIIFNSVDKHFAADEKQQDKRYPRDKAFKNGKGLNHGMNAKPADEGHEELKDRKSSGDENHSARFHAALVKSVGKGDGKGVHRKTDSKANACDKKGKIHP